MSETQVQIPATEIRVYSIDLNHHGKPDTVIIEFYKKGVIEYAVEVMERDETGFTKLVSQGVAGVNDKKLIDLANLVFHLH